MRASASAGSPANIPIGLIGSETDLTYRVQQLGTAPNVLTALHDGSHDFARRCATPSSR